MKIRSQIFKNGGSQAVRLPKECRFPADVQSVLVHRDGGRVILEPIDEWSDEMRSALGSWKKDIPRPKQDKPRDPFA